MFKLKIFIICVLLTFISTKFSLPFLRKFIIDKPNLRSSHKNLTPSGGGITFVLVSILFSQFVEGFNFILLLPLAIIGFIDDKLDLPSWIRYLTQFLTTIFIFYNSDLYYFALNNIDNNLLITIIFLLIIFAGTGIVNFINFMDGIDSLIVSTLFIIFFLIGLFQSNYSSLILSACLLGFLPWNYPPAKVFMGDIGSTFLGAYFVSLVYSNDFVSAIFILLIIFPILFDPFVTLLVRFMDGQKIFSAHKLHLYQRLNEGKLSNIQVVYVYFLTILINCIVYFYLDSLFLLISNSIWIAFGIYLNKRFAIPFKSIQKNL